MPRKKRLKPMPSPETPQERTLRNQREYYSGLSLGDIAKREGTSRTTVHKRLKKIGTVFRSNDQPSPVRQSRKALLKAQELEEQARKLRETATHPFAK